MSSLVLLFVVVDKSPAKDPRRALQEGRGPSWEHWPFPCLSGSSPGRKATLKSEVSAKRVWDMEHQSWKSLWFKGWGCSSVAECLFSMCKALGFIPTIGKNKTKQKQ
jgi:hypothetical protein